MGIIVIPQVKFKKCEKRVTSCMMRERKQKCGNFTVIAGNLEGLDTFKFPLELKDLAPHSHGS
jgi:hypothetical protein